LIQQSTLKCHHHLDFLSPSLIRNNYQRLDLKYQRKNQQTIDYRLFLPNRFTTLTPTKHSNLTKKHHLQQPALSHKILDYDLEIEPSVDKV
jgi:hypothetical protein